ncbi:MAG: DUF4349 domain-containing protein [Methanolinea sp.]|nr:DUF4349 domain-containing protein [Methanolinea sp.]
MIRPVVLASCLLILLLVCSGCLTTPWDTNSLGEGGKVVASWDGSRESPSLSGDTSFPAPAPAAIPAGYSSDEIAADQKIIRTSQINLEVQNVTSSLEPLKQIASARGGYIGSLSVNSRGGDRMYAVLTMRIPAREFDAAITEIKALGTLKSESLSAEDVTEEYIDLQAQRSGLANQLTQYNRIMEKAENVSDILEVQVQIERVQVQIDRIDSRLKYLDSRVDYSTITVTLEEPEPVGGGEGFSLISVLNQGIEGFLGVTALLIIFLIAIIPLILLGAIVYAIYRWGKGRKIREQKVPGEPVPQREEKPPVQ